MGAVVVLPLETCVYVYIHKHVNGLKCEILVLYQGTGAESHAALLSVFT
jgi:hypothetical protein